MSYPPAIRTTWNPQTFPTPNHWARSSDNGRSKAQMDSQGLWDCLAGGISYTLPGTNMEVEKNRLPFGAIPIVK